MRIGLVIYGSLETRSGGYLYDRKLVEALTAQGDEVIVLSQPWRSYARRLLDNLDRNLLASAKAARLDLLLQDELNHPSLAVQNLWLSRTLGIPLISIVHHLRSSEAHPPAALRFCRTVERAYLGTINGCIYNSANTRAAVEALLPAPRPGIVAHPGGDHIAPPPAPVIHALIDQRVRVPAPLRLLSVGNIIPRKNLHTLLRALSRLPRSGWRLTIVGSLSSDINYVNQLHRVVAQQKLTDSVRFLGPVSTQTLRQLYAAHHVMALPSIHEGFGIAYLEAMAFGTVPLAARQGAAGELIVDGESGLLVDAQDDRALAARLADFMQRRADRREFAFAARARYDEMQTWAESMARIGAWLRAFG
ncbi:MAG: glycosyltransferase family 4 protein [Caldilineaceae bacterium]|nr:glycosyltransferase family 4 protein [Caldilineaceae bacterium]